MSQCIREVESFWSLTNLFVVYDMSDTRIAGSNPLHRSCITSQLTSRQIKATHALECLYTYGDTINGA